MQFGWRWSFTLAFAMAGAVSDPWAQAEDWSRFRGPNGSGVSTDKEPLPATWSETENLKWKVTLPGPGNSCPIVVGDKVFVTCWSGYADGTEGGSLENLKRHLVCIDRKTGKELWTYSVAATLPEDSYRGMFAENGYASHTPVSDGEMVYVFFGKSGIHAVDMEGKHVWDKNVGTELDGRGWGSASSPILYKDKVIVTAAIENHAIVALDKKTGEKKWEQIADGFGSTWGTPVLVETGERTELVIAVPFELWALNPEDGKLLWYCEAINSNSMCSSVIAHEGIVYGMESGPGGGGSVAVKAGGKGDVTQTHKVWSNRESSRIGTPVIHDGLMYHIKSGIATAMDIKTGEKVPGYQKRLQADAGGENRNDNNQEERPRGFGQPGGGRGFPFGGGGRGGGQDYSSPIIADGKIFYAKRNGDIYVLKVGKEFEQLAVNRFESAEGDFNASPAVSNGELFIRSSKTLYCVAEEAEVEKGK